ncbi:MAG: hypothetical protein D6729_16335 [Deltaproteobacteria bacterium]|nr:MAG: hypothetical protein D6729_16335 [Deltaproteobacteria bacterium]
MKRRIGHRMLRTLVVAGALAGAGAAAWIGSEPPAAEADDAPYEAGFFGGLVPAYPGSWGQARVADSLEVSGLPVEMATFQTADAPETVIDFYAKAFAAEGLEVQVTDSRGEAGGGVVAWDERTRLRRQVMVIRQGGETHVFPSLLRDQPPLEIGALRPTGLPPGPDGALLISEVAARDGRVRSRTYSMVTQVPLEAAHRSLRERLRRAGFSVRPTRDTGVGLVLEAKGPAGAVYSYTLNGGDGRPTGVTVIVRSAGE